MSERTYGPDDANWVAGRMKVNGGVGGHLTNVSGPHGRRGHLTVKCDICHYGRTLNGTLVHFRDRPPANRFAWMHMAEHHNPEHPRHQSGKCPVCTRRLLGDSGAEGKS